MTIVCLLLSVLSVWDYPTDPARLDRNHEPVTAAAVANGPVGELLVLGAHNHGWNFETGCFEASIRLEPGKKGGNAGDLYVNRDGRHSMLVVTNFPGLTPVRLDEAGRERRLDLTIPNTLYPYPVFGNCSMAVTEPVYWRSIPRAMTTISRDCLRQMQRFYLSNQTWVFPSNADTPPVGTNGDVFASLTPYWLTTAGRSWSDLPYLGALVRASAALPPETKAAAVRFGLLAPTLQVLLRKALVGVKGEAGYLTARAHPTALPPNGLDERRLLAAAAALKPEEIPPLAIVDVLSLSEPQEQKSPELIYAMAFACSYVLRPTEPRRRFQIRAHGATEFRFFVSHGDSGAATVETLTPRIAVVEVNVSALSPTHRVDVAVVGRNPGTGWGAPSYVSFARMDASAPYSDPALTAVGTEKREPAAK